MIESTDTNGSNVAPLFTSKEWNRLLSQVGIGNPAGHLWFIGMEESLGREDAEINVRRRLQGQLSPFTTFDAFIKPSRTPTQTWPIMAKLARLLLDNASDWDDLAKAKAYIDNQLARSGGETCLLELLPLASDTTADWPTIYQEGFPTRKLYEQGMLDKRIYLLGVLASLYRPQIVICYGYNYWQYYRNIFSLTEGDMHPNLYEVGKKRLVRISVGRWHDTTIILTPFFKYDFLPHVVLGDFKELVAQFT